MFHVANHNELNKITPNYKSFGRIAAFSFLILYFTGLSVWSWRKWPDILIDFGRELYTPWQISAGKVLYQDISHLFGPLSQYINACLFYIFGPSYLVIISVNMVVLALCLCLIYIVLLDITSDLTSLICCGLILSVFSFSQYVGIGNYNFISPYAHEAAHGTFLSVLMIHQFWRFSKKNRHYNLILAGMSFGLICLTKIEILFSALIVAGFFFFLMWYIYKNAGDTIKSAGIFVVSSLFPISIFGAYFLSVMPFETAFTAVFNAFTTFYQNREIANNEFYMTVMGLDHPLQNILTMVVYSLIAMMAIIATLFLCHMLKKYKNSLPAAGILMLLLAVIISLSFYVNLSEIGRLLPLLTFAALFFLFYLFQKSMREEGNKAINFIPIILWSVFALLFLLRMILNCRMFHYGFYLTLPAAVTIVCVLTWYLPQWFDMRYSGGGIFKIVTVIVVIIISLKFITVSNAYYKAKTFSVGEGSDRIITYEPRYDSRSLAFSQAIKWINANIKERETVIVLPEGVMINYLSRRVNPTPYINFMPPEMQIFGEDNMLDAIKNNSPDYFVIVSRDTKEYGYDYFGRDTKYGQKIMNWVNQRYHRVVLFGDEPLVRDGFGIKIMKRGNE